MPRRISRVGRSLRRAPPTGGDYEWQEFGVSVACPHCHRGMAMRVRTPLAGGAPILVSPPVPTPARTDPLLCTGESLHDLCGAQVRLEGQGHWEWTLPNSLGWCTLELDDGARVRIADSHGYFVFGEYARLDGQRISIEGTLSWDAERSVWSLDHTQHLLRVGAPTKSP